MYGYHPANVALVEDEAHWKVRVIAVIAWLLNIQVKVEGLPFGGEWKGKHRTESGSVQGC